MSRIRTVITIMALASIALLLSPARGQEDDAESRLGKALETILMRLVKTGSGGLRLGISERQAVKETRGATDLAGDRILPLAATHYAPEGDWAGTVRVFMTGEPGAKLDSIQVSLLCGDYDETRMARRLVEIGRKLGFAFEVDDEAQGSTWFDAAFHERDLWVSFGAGVIGIDADLCED